MQNHILSLKATCQNIKTIFQTIPTQSPLRKQLLKQLKHNINVNFVAEVFSKHVIPVISKYKSVYLFSDGDPKHFKISSMLNMVLEAADDLINTKIEHHFFVSHHGHGICDSAAAHAKAAINRHINRTLTTPVNAKEICDIINTVKLRRGIPIHEPSTPVNEVKPFRGIRALLPRLSFGQSKRNNIIGILHNRPT